jgi:hypothetical protein
LRRLGSGVWKVGTFKVVAPPVSVKNQCVGPYEQVLNIPIACWWYGSSKLMYLCHHLAKTSLLYSKAIVREGK